MHVVHALGEIRRLEMVERIAILLRERDICFGAVLGQVPVRFVEQRMSNGALSPLVGEEAGYARHRLLRIGHGADAGMDEPAELAAFARDERGLVTELSVFRDALGRMGERRGDERLIPKRVAVRYARGDGIVNADKVAGHTGFVAQYLHQFSVPRARARGYR